VGEFSRCAAACSLAAYDTYFMGTYNRLKTEITCPRCLTVAEVEVDCYFGHVWEMKNYKVGDSYDWVPRKAIQNGGRPEGGDVDGEGYTDCPSCKKDFFVKVIVRKDLIQGVKPDLAKRPHILD
jgi:uncharacterized C2H2 Zn-finger protein